MTCTREMKAKAERERYRRLVAAGLPPRAKGTTWSKLSEEGKERRREYDRERYPWVKVKEAFENLLRSRGLL